MAKHATVKLLEPLIRGPEKSVIMSLHATIFYHTPTDHSNDTFYACAHLKRELRGLSSLMSFDSTYVSNIRTCFTASQRLARSVSTVVSSMRSNQPGGTTSCSSARKKLISNETVLSLADTCARSTDSVYDRVRQLVSCARSSASGESTKSDKHDFLVCDTYHYFIISTL